MDLCDRNDIQALLARHGFHFAKALGQNFLIRGDVAEDIAAAGCVPGCGVLEVGPGIGALTVQLARRAERWFRWSWTSACRRCWRRLWRTMTTSP